MGIEDMQKRVDRIKKKINGLGGFWISELRKRERKEIDWIVDKLIRPSSFSLIGSKTFNGKTWTALTIAICCAMGIPLFGRYPCKKIKVLVIDKEDSYDSLTERILMLEKGMNINLEDNLCVVSETDFMLHGEENYNKLRDYIKDNQFELVIFDTLRCFSTAKENDSDEVAKFINLHINPLIKETNASLLFIHHYKKGNNDGDDLDAIRGSGAWGGAINSAIDVKLTSNCLLFKQIKNKNGRLTPPIKLKVETDEKTYWRWDYMGEAVFRTAEQERADEIIGWYTSKNLSSFQTGEVSIKGNRTQISDALTYLVNKGFLMRPTRGHFEILVKSNSKLMY